MVLEKEAMIGGYLMADQVQGSYQKDSAFLVSSLWLQKSLKQNLSDGPLLSFSVSLSGQDDLTVHFQVKQADYLH